ncbi:MAG: endo-alpha-N-acetylgalactosaminidase family protein [Lachnospiraceae bacterium]
MRKKVTKRLLASVLSFVMVLSTVLGAAPALTAQAAPIVKTMAHLVAGPDNGNGHFGGATPEAFVLSEKADITNEDFSFMMKLTETAGSRVRFVNKYADDTHWSYIGYDGARTSAPYWFAEYKNGGSIGWPNITELPALEAGDIITVDGKYTEDGLVITVENLTQGTRGTGTVSDQEFLDLQNTEGQIGFGAGRYTVSEEQITDIYFCDVKTGDEVLGFSDFAAYEKSAGGFTWEQAQVEIGDDGIEEPEAEARKWFVLQGGANNSGGHNYGNGTAKGPLFYTDSSRKMVSGGTISMALKPSLNWGVFYSYIDDNNWLYVGHDTSSKWYYQYKWNGEESYPKISGLPEPVEGEEMSLTISLSNETLAVTVNGTTAYATNQKLKDFAAGITEANGDMGKFGVMTKGATQISFADFKYDGEDCMDDAWVFNAERDGQVVRKEITALETVTGTVKNPEGKAVSGATVRIGTKSATTAIDGTYRIPNVQIGDYVLSVSKAGYKAYTADITVAVDAENVFDAVLEPKEGINLADYDSIESDGMKVYIGKDFPVVARYEMKSDAAGKTFFRGNETELNTVVINGHEIEPTVTVKATETDYRVYGLEVEDAANSISLSMDVKISVEANTLTWEVTELTKNDGCKKIATIDIPHLNLLSVDSTEEESVFAGAKASTTTTSKADTYITFDNGFIPSNEDGYLYAFLTNGKLSAGLHSNSEIEGDKRVERINGADSISLTSAVWYYECGDKAAQNYATKYDVDYDYPVSELPQAKVAIADGDLNNDGQVDWNDGAIAFRDVMHTAQGSEAVKDLVNYRIVMNFASMAPNPFLTTADSIKKVYLATDGLPQAVMLKGYGNEGHDSANSEYADIAEREGGVEDFQDLIKIAHDYNAEIGIHVNAQEVYSEAKSLNDAMVSYPNGAIFGNGWGWLDQSTVINKLWDLSSQARLKRFVQLYDRINGTDFYSGDWEKGEYVKDSQGTLNATLAEIKADAETRKDNMDFIYLDVWYQDSWETRRIAEEINSLGWRFSTEFSGEGEYDSTWQHWSTDTTYGGAGAKGLNSDIIRFLRNDQRDSQVLNWPNFGGTADNPLLGGFRLYGFEGWQGNQNFDEYIYGTFDENLPTKFFQHYEIIDWENYGDDGSDDTSPVGNTEKEITLANDKGDVVVVSRVEEQRDDIAIERVATLNGKVVLNTTNYLLPWTIEGEGEKLYHWNADGGETTWELQDNWANLENVFVYELSDQGRINETKVPVVDGTLTLDAKAGTAYVVVKGAEIKKLKADFGECDYVVDPGFNGYADGAQLDAADWSGDITDKSVVIERSSKGDQKLVMNSPAKDVAVSTTISGLTAGEDYVAEIYVENQSEAKAAITVDAGEKTVSNYTEESILNNYVQCDMEHGTMMQRIQVSFVAESDTATFTLSREAGKGATYWDDIRIVNQKVDNFKEDGSFEQDFESVVQGLYPFVLSRAQGVSDPCTHLSQLNAPYTQAGWNGKVIDDVIEGEWSLKHHARNTGIIYQTIPQNFRFEPGKVYTVEFDYQTGSAGYNMVVGDGSRYAAPTSYLPIAAGETKHAEMQVIASGSGQTWIGLYQAGGLCGETARGTGDFVLDNLKITVDENAVAVAVSDTDLLLGETATIVGSGLDKITWSLDTEGVIQLDTEKLEIKAIGAGTAVLTADLGNGEVQTFTFKVTDTIVHDIPREEFSGISVTANTEEAGGEGPVNGYATAAIDGDSSTFWHSEWSGKVFSVSVSNPAILTVDLGTTLDIGGFKFQQRNGSNGIVSQYSYNIKDAEGNVVASGEHIPVDSALRAGGAWVNVILDETVNAQVIEFKVESGSGGFACLAEIAPIRVEKITIDDEFEFEDVSADDYFHDAVYWAVENNITDGWTDTTFAPELTCTRGQVVAFLWRANGCPKAENEAGFADVPADHNFAEAIAWAVEKKITDGWTEDTFAPEETVTRGQVVTFLWRAAGRPEADATVEFEDVDADAYYAEAVAWAVDNEVTNGWTETTFAPGQECTRGEIVTFIYRAR